MNELQSKPHSRTRAILMQRCPGCLQGRVFSGSITMNVHCPVCGIRFEREAGYFAGAMYFSYAIAATIMGVFLLVGHLLLPEADLGNVALVCIVLFLPLVPVVFRYSRVIWLHFDQWAQPRSPS